MSSEESPRCVRMMCGGAANTEDVTATGRVRAFITQVKERNKHNPNDFYFLKGYYIHNLTIEVLKESGATKLLDSLKLPKDLYCPSALYTFMIKLHGSTPPSKPPKHERVQAYADKSLMRKLDEVTAMCEDIENYYADAYEYIVNLHLKPEFELLQKSEMSDEKSKASEKGGTEKQGEKKKHNRKK